MSKIDIDLQFDYKDNPEFTKETNKMFLLVIAASMLIAALALSALLLFFKWIIEL